MTFMYGIVVVSNADNIHAADQRLVQHFFCLPAPVEQNLRALGNLFEHLHGRFVIGKLRQNDIFVFVNFLRHIRIPL